MDKQKNMPKFPEAVALADLALEKMKLLAILEGATELRAMYLNPLFAQFPPTINLFSFYDLLYESNFATDIDGLYGYKRLVQLNSPNLLTQYVITLFKNKAINEWRILDIALPEKCILEPLELEERYRQCIRSYEKLRDQLDNVSDVENELKWLLEDLHHCSYLLFHAGQLHKAKYLIKCGISSSAKLKDLPESIQIPSLLQEEAFKSYAFSLRQVMGE